MSTVFFWFESFISGVLPLTFISVAGAVLTFKTRASQIRNFFKALRFSLLPNKKSENGISSFGAVCNSLAATVGTGNIAGVAAAISIGGAGAVFWMWITAFLSMVIKSLEITVAVRYRKKENGAYVGGPVNYIKEGLSEKFSFLAKIFAFSGVFSAFATGNITQINACTSVVGGSFYLKLTVGIIFCTVTGFVIVGGAQKITKFTTAVLPLMSVLYIVFCLGVIIKNFSSLGDVFLMILKGAVLPASVTGGAVGSVMSVIITGAQKGIFSNEAGLGTAGIAHASAVDAKVETQGFFGIFEVFVDTLLICTLTALTILSSGVIIDYSKVASSTLVAQSLSTVYGVFSNVALSVMLCLFGISSVIGWANYGISFANYLWEEKGKKVFVLVYPLFCIAGAVMEIGFAWRLAEFFNGVMLCINLFAVLLLSDEAIPILKGEKYETKDRKIAKYSRNR